MTNITPEQLKELIRQEVANQTQELQQTLKEMRKIAVNLQNALKQLK